MPKPISVEGAVTLPHEPEELWPYVTDTNRLDRAIGLPPARFTRLERDEGGEVNVGEYRILGLALARWTEHPFQWERPHRYSIRRDYQYGPLTRFDGGAELLPVPGGSRIRVFAEFTPRSLLHVPLIRLVIAPGSIRRACRQYEAIGAFLAGRSTDPFPVLAQSRSPADLARLDATVARLEAEGAAQKPLAHLRRMLAEAADEDVLGMRPLELAARWATGRQQTLETFLTATVAGLLEMRWELLCPSCRGVKADAAHLNDLASTGHCSACNLELAANVDEAIEARFYPAASVRPLGVGTYCVGSPAQTTHRLAHMVLESGGRSDWRLSLRPGPYLIRSPQGRAVCQLRAETVGGPDFVEVTVESMNIDPEQAEVKAGEMTIRVVNATAHRATIALDDGRWSDAAASPSRLMSFPAFRTLFSSEALAPGVELAIGCAGLLFTDLAGSTELYERAGDAQAFRLVSDHFSIVQASIEAAGGAMVKTIGDAVMAGFPNGLAALAAGLAIQRDIRNLDARDLVDATRLIKVGVHVGPCFAVTLNERLDYFGTAVNLAARAQHEARGGEVVATAAVIEEAGQLLEPAQVQGDPFDVLLKGFSQPSRLYRIDCAHLPAPVRA